jgi:hypothetical protein
MTRTRKALVLFGLVVIAAGATYYSQEELIEHLDGPDAMVIGFK